MENNENNLSIQVKKKIEIHIRPDRKPKSTSMYLDPDTKQLAVDLKEAMQQDEDTVLYEALTLLKEHITEPDTSSTESQTETGENQ